MRRLFAWYVNQNFRENVVPRLPLLFNEYQKFITKKYGIKSDQNEIHLFLSGKLLHLILSELKYSLSSLTGKEKSEKNDSIQSQVLSNCVLCKTDYRAKAAYRPLKVTYRK